MPTRGERKTAHIYGTIALQDASFTYQFVDVFNGKTFLGFLQTLLRRYRRKVFLIIDNGPCHNLGAEGRAWLARVAVALDVGVAVADAKALPLPSPSSSPWPTSISRNSSRSSSEQRS